MKTTKKYSIEVVTKNGVRTHKRMTDCKELAEKMYSNFKVEYPKRITQFWENINGEFEYIK